MSNFARRYFAGLTIFLVVVLGYIGHQRSDIEYRLYTVVRMHACDILKNDRSTLQAFDPDKCQVKRSNAWIGKVVDVTCSTTDVTGGRRNSAKPTETGI